MSIYKSIHIYIYSSPHLGKDEVEGVFHLGGDLSQLDAQQVGARAEAVQAEHARPAPPTDIPSPSTGVGSQTAHGFHTESPPRYRHDLGFTPTTGISSSPAGIGSQTARGFHTESPPRYRPNLGSTPPTGVPSLPADIGSQTVRMETHPRYRTDLGWRELWPGHGWRSGDAFGSGEGGGEGHAGERTGVHSWHVHSRRRWGHAGGGTGVHSWHLHSRRRWGHAGEMTGVHS